MPSAGLVAGRLPSDRGPRPARTARGRPITLASGAPARVQIDGLPLLDVPADGVLTKRIALTRGPHLVTVEYDHSIERADLDLQWDERHAYRLETIPPSALSPRPLGKWGWRV